MIRILQCVNNMHRAGLETMLMNYYRNIDREKIQFDFLTHRPERSDYDDEIESLGGRIYHAPRLYPKNYPAYFSYMKGFFQEHPEYQIMHSHIDTMSYLPLLAGRMNGIPVRIAHSHSTSIDRDFKYVLKQFFRFGVPRVATHRLACGQAAGEFLFGKKSFQVITNAIDAQRFFYDPEIRQKKRAELGLEGKVVVGHVGRFCYPKNHGFLIDIFAKVAEKENNAMLFLVGTGEKETDIRQKVHDLGLQERVLFLGSRGDVNELYQAMDVFLMPSLFEGVPMVGIESQFAGVPCLFSNKVPQEVMFTERCEFVSLDSTTEQWADRVLYWALQQRSGVQLMDSPYDIIYAGRILEQYYLDLNDRLENDYWQ